MKQQGLIRGNDAVDSNILRQMSDMAARIAKLEQLLLTQDHANRLYLSIEDASPTMHPAVSLDSDADTLLSLATQELGLDAQNDNLIFAGPATGGPAVPSFRSLVDADIPSAITRDSELTAHTALPDVHHAKSHVLADTSGLGADHTTSGLTAGQVLRATGATTAAFGAIQDSDIPSAIARDSEVTAAIAAHAADEDAHHSHDGDGHVAIGARVGRSAVFNVTDSTWTAIPFTTEAYDTSGFHDNSTNNTRLTAPEDGLYLITGTVNWSSTSPTDHKLSIIMNGTDTIDLDVRRVDTGAIAYTNTVSTVMEMTAGDYVELSAWQNSTVTLAIQVGTGYFPPTFTITKLSNIPS